MGRRPRSKAEGGTDSTRRAGRGTGAMSVINRLEEMEARGSVVHTAFEVYPREKQPGDRVPVPQAMQPSTRDIRSCRKCAQNSLGWHMGGTKVECRGPAASGRTCPRMVVGAEPCEPWSPLSGHRQNDTSCRCWGSDRPALCASRAPEHFPRGAPTLLQPLAGPCLKLAPP
jgi:hypothetical protein